MTKVFGEFTAPSIVLVRPQMGENIGAAARAMLNFGFERMRIVSPRDGWPNQKAVAMASGAGRVLDQAQLFNDVPSALFDGHYSYATTARARDMNRPVLSPQQATQDALRRISRGEKVHFIFGPERSGLENEDIAHASALVTVPVNPAYASLNLAQCVLLVCYEFMRQFQEGAFSGKAGEIAPSDQSNIAANSAQISALGDHYEDALSQAGFFWPEAKAPSMKLHLRAMWSRLELSAADVQMMHGIMRQMVRWKNRATDPM